MRLWQVHLPRAVFAVVADERGIVRVAAPIGRWMIGKMIDAVRAWVRRKRGTMNDLGPDPANT